MYSIIFGPNTKVWFSQWQTAFQRLPGLYSCFFLTTKSDNNHASSLWLNLVLISIECWNLYIPHKRDSATSIITLWHQCLHLSNSHHSNLLLSPTTFPNRITSFPCALQLLIFPFHWNNLSIVSPRFLPFYLSMALLLKVTFYCSKISLF